MIWIASVVLAVVQLCAAYAFHLRIMWQSLRHAEWLRISSPALTNANVYKQTLMIIAKSSPALMIALPVALVTYVVWRRARYFGNTAPLLVAGLFVVLGMASPHFPGAILPCCRDVSLYVRGGRGSRSSRDAVSHFSWVPDWSACSRHRRFGTCCNSRDV